MQDTLQSSDSSSNPDSNGELRPGSTGELPPSDNGKIQRINWINAAILVVTPFLTIVGLVLYISHEGVHISDWVTFATLYFLTGLSITAGYHRYYSHRAYECHPWVRFLFLVFGAAAFENSALRWVSDHRNHHRYVDREGDPYNIKKGFVWAHIGWAFFESNLDESTLDNVKDLKRSKLVRWQHRFYVPIGILAGFGSALLMGFYFGRPWGGLLWGGLVRMVALHHSTFLINSAAHYFGSQPYSSDNTARDNGWLALFSFGEGYHNYHHAYPSDYRNGTAWYHWDPTKWLIRSLSWAKLTWGMRSPSGRH